MTTQTLTTYSIRYRHPNVDGPHGYEGPAFDMRVITLTLCAWHKGRHMWDDDPVATEWNGSDCDVCSAAEDGRNFVTLVIEKALGV